MPQFPVLAGTQEECPGTGGTVVLLVTMCSHPPAPAKPAALPKMVPVGCRTVLPPDPALPVPVFVGAEGWGGQCNLHPDLSHKRSCPHQKCAEQSFSSQGGLTPRGPREETRRGRRAPLSQH
ncbi:unnamed protein product [Rangifer tarandus platyrhynchus]|uniref:Uncharacterized protein n=1 Tax=Rangifer tarandus platyrhynchus TaxID=3082113 RepID=A0AC59ZT09_RANTA